MHVVCGIAVRWMFYGYSQRSDITSNLEIGQSVRQFCSIHDVRKYACQVSQHFKKTKFSDFSLIFLDEVSKFHDNYYGNLTPHFHIFTLIALCTYCFRLWKSTLITCFYGHTLFANRPIKIPWLFPDLRNFAQIHWLFPDWKKVK